MQPTRGYGIEDAEDGEKVKKLLTEMYATTRAAFTKSMLKTDRAVLLPIVYLNVDIRQS